jgi:hypothetical protein
MTQTVEYATSKDDGTACQHSFSSSGVNVSPCTDVSKSEVSNIQGATPQDGVNHINDISVRRHGPLRGSPGDRYFAAGTYALIYNAWQGQLVMQGPNSAPTWTMRNGSQTASGTTADSKGDANAGIPADGTSAGPDSATALPSDSSGAAAPSGLALLRTSSRSAWAGPLAKVAARLNLMP